MSSKQGYKVVLVAGEALLRVLDASRPERREVAPVSPLAVPGRQLRRERSQDEQRAVERLKEFGVLPSKAEDLVAQFGVDSVLDTVDYLSATAFGGKRKSIENPAGLLIYSLENKLPVPATFMSSRKQQAVNEAKQHEASEASRREAELFLYREWLEREQDQIVRAQFSQAELDLKLAQTVRELTESDKRFRNMTSKGKMDFARRTLLKELGAEVVLPGFEEWRAKNLQTSLFN